MRDRPRPCRYGQECYREGCPFFHKERDPSYRGNPRFNRKRNFNGPKVNVSPHSYITADLLEQEVQGYKSAGVLPFRKDENDKVWLLLGVERRKRSDPTPYLNFLGGKRDQNDSDAVDTAVRELFEETGKLLAEERVLEIAQSLREKADRQVMWVAAGKYALLPYEMNHDFDLPERFGSAQANRAFSPVNSLHWVEISELLESVKQGKDHLSSESGARLNIYSFLAAVLLDSVAVDLLPLRLAEPIMTGQERS